MEEDFYATIKLVSGEEVFSKVCPCEEEDRILLILDNPIMIEMIHIRQLGITSMKVNPWIRYSDDSMFIIDMENVLTMSEVKNLELIKIHNKFVKEKYKKTNKTTPSQNMGYVSSVAEARVLLEKLYKSNS